ncbi:aspartic proteinase [Suillus bovinus]|uniref:aspartic proteinase n=1 Tax=Suillus bovinus TaxID=48563 RepID=UPI001B870DB7|nr:aspartic proteinase [Suillus bovinus]KAG2156946.1 aspartic proteinase [Suillus bovinus]
MPFLFLTAKNSLSVLKRRSDARTTSRLFSYYCFRLLHLRGVLTKHIWWYHQPLAARPISRNRSQNPVGIGDPATIYNLLVDTGSSLTWVNAASYVKTSTSVDTGQAISSSYGSGTEYTDTVTLGNLTIIQQPIGVISESTFTGITVGVIGIGPLDLTEGILRGSPPTATIPTVTDNLYIQDMISQIVVGVSFEPTTSESDTNGELTFGGIDAIKYTGAVAYTPLTTTEPASYYWGINESITYGSTTILSETAGIVDTGTTLILIASNAFSAYQSGTGAIEDETTGLFRITSTQYSALVNLNFNVGNNTYALTPNGQIWPRALNTYIGGSTDYIYLIVNDFGTPSGEGLDFINGYTFLERFYSVFDTTNSQVGFAATAYTTATTN